MQGFCFSHTNCHPHSVCTDVHTDIRAPLDPSSSSWMPQGFKPRKQLFSFTRGRESLLKGDSVKRKKKPKLQNAPSHGNSHQMCLLPVFPGGSPGSRWGGGPGLSPQQVAGPPGSLAHSGVRGASLTAVSPGSAPAWRPLPLASLALSWRPGEDGALTAGGRAPPPSARRRAPSSSAGTPRRRSTAVPASAASFPLAGRTCDGAKRARRVSPESPSPELPRSPF